MNITKNFEIQEFVPPEIYNKYGEKSTWFISPEIPIIAQELRDSLSDKFSGNRVIVKINDWHTGGDYKYSGYRPPNIDDEIKGAFLSQHKLGKAMDIKVYLNNNKLDPKEIYKFILDNKTKFMNLGLTTMEDINYTKTWNHLDCRNRLNGQNLQDILIVKP